MIIGVDVGGTFTDVFFLDEASQKIEIAKVPSTPEDSSRGFLQGLGTHAKDWSRVRTVVHGTTVGTNALLSRKGAKTGILTTRGFRDVLEMRRRDRPNTWGLWGQFEPVVPRNMRFEVSERILADGTLHTPVDLEVLEIQARKLLDMGAEAVSLFFINSYSNPENEILAAQKLRDIWPNPHVSVSHEILPEIREFERISTTALNAYLQPVIGNYLENLDQKMRSERFGGELLIVQSNGGVMSVETAERFPVRTALSGPAAGVIASSYLGMEAGFPNLISCDMGGTSFDVSLIRNGESALAPQTSIGFGMVVRTPMIEITTIGAGGGSIANVDQGGLLEVGPESAGSDPGPVCYGNGNKRPTVTDANLVLGRINGEKPIGGKLEQLDSDAAHESIREHIAQPLSMEVMDAAEAIIRVANSKMAGAIRLISIEQGHNPQDFAAVSFGGGGSLHVCSLIREVGLSRALVPRYPGVTSALGCVIADMRHDRVQTLNTMLDQLDLPALIRRMEEFCKEGLDLLQASGVFFKRQEVRFELDMSYLGQTHTVDVPILEKTLQQSKTQKIEIQKERVLKAFEQRYKSLYGRLLENLPIRILNLKASVIGIRPKLDLTLLAPINPMDPDSCRLGETQVWFEGAWHPTMRYQRLELAVGSRIQGPALFEQPDTTIFLEPSMDAEVDRFGNLIIIPDKQ